MRGEAPPAWTTRRLLAWIADALTKKGVESPRLCAELLVSHVIGCDRLRLYMDPDRPAAPLERENLRSLVARALDHEPVQYLVGEAWFFALAFKVDRRVLIPRPSSETIVEEVLQHARSEGGVGGARGEGVLLADIGTGSGCLAVALLSRLTGARGIATDLSADALALAGENARRHGVADRMDLVEGDLLDALRAHPIARARASLHYLVSNPPYIPDAEWPGVPPNVRLHEPEAALRGGGDGLDFVRRLLAEGPWFLRPRGLLLVEIAESTHAEALGLAESSPDLEGVRILEDFEGRPRVVVGRKK